MEKEERRKTRYVNFTKCNKRLLNDFKVLTKSLGYSFAKANSTNACLYRKEEVANFIKSIKPFKAEGVCGNLDLPSNARSN